MGIRASNGRGVVRETSPITVVIPTRNEADNVAPLLSRLASVSGATIETVIFVDDSDDETPDRARELQDRYQFDVRVLHREESQRQGGLGSAVVTGLRAATTRYAVVMDGDLQHPPELIGELARTAVTAGASLVVASRYIGDGSSDGLSSGVRRAVSNGANALVRKVFRSEIGKCSDPMSGFFLVELDRIDINRLQPRGFKILMEIAVCNSNLKLAEVPFVFAERVAGETKAGFVEGIRYLNHVASLLRRTRRRQYLYQIHHHSTVRSTSRLPELEHFRVEKLDGPVVIDVRTTWRPGKGLDRVDLRYRELLGPLGFSVALEGRAASYSIEVAPMLRLSPHVLYTNVVEPVLRWSLTEGGYALIHAATIESEGVAHLVTAQTDTGKTTTMLQLLKSGQFRFMADDLMIAADNGRIWSYPKPLTISAHTLRAVNAKRLKPFQRLGLPIQSRIHSRSGRKVAFTLARSRLLPVATINMLVQMVVPPPKYFVETLVNGVKPAITASIGKLYVIARGERAEEVLPADEAIETLLANCEDAFGFPPYAELEQYLRYRNGGDLMDEYHRIVRAAIGGQGAVQFTSNDYDWAEKISAAVDELEHVVIDLTSDEAQSSVSHDELDSADDDYVSPAKIARTG